MDNASTLSQSLRLKDSQNSHLMYKPLAVVLVESVSIVTPKHLVGGLALVGNGMI